MEEIILLVIWLSEHRIKVVRIVNSTTVRLIINPSSWRIHFYHWTASIIVFVLDVIKVITVKVCYLILKSIAILGCSHKLKAFSLGWRLTWCLLFVIEIKDLWSSYFWTTTSSCVYLFMRIKLLRELLLMKVSTS